MLGKKKWKKKRPFYRTVLQRAATKQTKSNRPNETPASFDLDTERILFILAGLVSKIHKQHNGFALSPPFATHWP